MKKVSIVTPTLNRPAFLMLSYKCFTSQNYKNIEWLILDDSDEPNQYFIGLKQENIIYQYSASKLSIGEKRNRLIEKATGEIIVNFDDDDYYSPNYISEMAATLENNNSDLINLRSFFLFSSVTRNFGYWELMVKEGLHFKMSPEGIELVMLNKQNNKGFDNNHYGFGFGYAFKKQVWEKNPYPSINFNEDGLFALNAQRNFKLGGFFDVRGICLHFIHQTNTSSCFPQYILPPSLMSNFFHTETIDEYLKASLIDI